MGGDGSDTYQVSSTEDKITETAKDGNQDVVKSSVSYELGDNLEVLTLTGTGSIDGTGNRLDNTLEGNDADNQLLGESGNHRLYGFAGDDTLNGEAGDDAIDGGDGQDQVVYLGNEADYKYYFDADSQTWTVKDVNGNDGDGVDTIVNAESLVFADNTVDLVGVTTPDLSPQQPLTG